MLEYVSVPVNLRLDRSKFIEGLNSKIGVGDWFWGFRVGKRLYSWNWGMQLYEDAYLEFIKHHVTLLNELVNYSNVFVLDRHDLNAGLDFQKQNQTKEHFSDIALRRCLVRLGVWFKGIELLKIPGSQFDEEKIPFHLPHLIFKPDKISSIKSWLSNRLIIAAKSIEDKAQLANVLIK